MSNDQEILDKLLTASEEEILELLDQLTSRDSALKSIGILLERDRKKYGDPKPDPGLPTKESRWKEPFI